MIKIVNADNNKQTGGYPIKNHEYDIREKFQKNRQKQQSGQKFHQRILPGNFTMASAAFSFLEQKTANGNELAPGKFFSASETSGIRINNGFAGIVPLYHYVQKTSDNRDEYKNEGVNHYNFILSHKTNQAHKRYYALGELSSR